MIAQKAIKQVVVCRGLSFPCFPMQPTPGRMIKTKTDARRLDKEINSMEWIVQPKLNGDRACLAVVDGQVHVQNRHGSWYRYHVTNASDFLRSPEGTAFDGEVYHGVFYPFEMLALQGKSMLFCSAAERQAVAFQLCKFLKQAWLFNQPTLNWLLRLSANRPQWEGVVMKQQGSPYILAGSDRQCNLAWFKRLFLP